MSRGRHLHRKLSLALALTALTAVQALAQSRGGTPVGPPSAPSAPSLQAPAPGSSGAPVPPMPIPNVTQVPGPTIVAPGPPQNITPLSLPPSPPATAQQAAPMVRPGEAALIAVARFGRDQPAITGGLHWRVYADKPDQTGIFRLVKEERAAQPTFVLPAGGYIVHVAFGLASAAKPVQLRDNTRETFELPAGGLMLKGQVGDVRIPAGQVTFDIYRGSQFEPGDKRPIATNVPSGDVVLIPDGTYYIVSKYGDGNAVVRSDIRVQVGKLTDVTVTHRAAAIMFKLVSRRGGEALVNTDWAVLSPAGDTITESKGAFPRVILAEGEYKVIARNENRTYQQDIKVITGVDGEIEVLAR